MLGGSEVIAAKVEEVIDLIVGREEALRLTGRFELLHLPLSSACLRIPGEVARESAMMSPSIPI